MAESEENMTTLTICYLVLVDGNVEEAKIDLPVSTDVRYNAFHPAYANGIRKDIEEVLISLERLKGRTFQKLKSITA